MKLLIAADIFPPESGGPATYCVTLANELVKQGAEVKIVSLNQNPDKSKVSCPVYSVWFKNKLLRYKHYLQILFWFARWADVVYAMGPVNAGLPAWVAARVWHKKFVVKVVGDYAWEQGQVSGVVTDSIDDFQNKKYSGKVAWLQKVEAFIVKRADQIIVPSKYLAGIVKGWGALEEKIKVIYNDVEWIVADPIKHDGEKWLVSAGRLMPWKGMDTLIEIMPEIIKQVPNVKLKIVGGGPEMGSLKLKVKNLQLENMVELTGSLSHDKTLSYIASANLFVLNSGYEGLSHVIVEAMNQGTPVIASSAGGNGEMVAPEGLFEYNNREQIVKQILSKINNERGSKIPHIFGGLSMVEKTKQAFSDLITSKPINR